MSPPFVQPRGECVIIIPINGHPICVTCANRRKNPFSIYPFAHIRIFRRFISQPLPLSSSGWPLVTPIRCCPKPLLHIFIAKVTYILVFRRVLHPSGHWYSSQIRMRLASQTF
eukprot:5556000-Ditylum_brightwellii.AAC.1